MSEESTTPDLVRLWQESADAADRRDTLAAIPGIQNRRLAARRPSAADRRGQHETGFIEKNKVGIAGLSFTDNAWKRTRLPIQNGGFIALARPSGRLLHGPAQTLKPGEVFYEPPNALHAISRNASTTQPLRYLVIQVSDPTKPATVPE